MDLSKVSVLIVDDVKTIHVQIGELLSTFGFTQIQAAATGEEAIAKIEAGSFNLILADWHMQPVDGLELLYYVRHHPNYEGVAFAMLTAENTRERVLEAIEAGVDDYLVKPLTKDQVQKRVLSLLKKKKVIS